MDDELGAVRVVEPVCAVGDRFVDGESRLTGWSIEPLALVPDVFVLSPGGRHVAVGGSLQPDDYIRRVIVVGGDQAWYGRLGVERETIDRVAHDSTPFDGFTSNDIACVTVSSCSFCPFRHRQDRSVQPHE